MNRITQITKRDIKELFCDGFIESNWLVGSQKCFYPYYGRLSEIEFLEKLYPLDKMLSYDDRFKNAKDDIWQHIINNNDWNAGWVFDDDRFELLKGSDNVILDFLCAVFHPEYRNEKGYWKEYLDKINYSLRNDGYELYESQKISGRLVYSWRKITDAEATSGKFIPFSVRKKDEIEKKAILLSIPKKARREVVELFNRYDESINKTNETGWNYSINTKEAVIEDVREHYLPMSFNATGKYSETNNIEEFVKNNLPYCVFDAIELFNQYNQKNNFADELNILLERNGFNYRLLGGKIELSQPAVQTKEIIREYGLKELISQATTLYNRSSSVTDKQIAVEKLWDAFERLKTYYPDLNKQKSANKIVCEMSNDNEIYKTLFNEEFFKLTKIGNEYRIRHHETDKIDIIDSNYYDYFFQRCFALVALALKYLN